MSEEQDTPVRRIRTILVEDDKPVRERLAGIIETWDQAELVAACGTVTDACEVIDAEPINLLVTDLKLPDGNGIEIIRKLAKQQMDAQAMVISVLADEKTVLDAIEAGATGYLLKDADTPDLIESILDLMAGRSPISSRIARVLIRRLSDEGGDRPASKDEAPVPALTPREMDILWGIAKGFTYVELAERLKISRQTVPVHIRNIYRKLQASNRSEAVYEATRLGIIRL